MLVSDFVQQILRRTTFIRDLLSLWIPIKDKIAIKQINTVTIAFKEQEKLNN